MLRDRRLQWQEHFTVTFVAAAHHVYGVNVGVRSGNLTAFVEELLTASLAGDNQDACVGRAGDASNVLDFQHRVHRVNDAHGLGGNHHVERLRHQWQEMGYRLVGL